MNCRLNNWRRVIITVIHVNTTCTWVAVEIELEKFQTCVRVEFMISMIPGISIRGYLHDTGATFAPERVHSCSLSWLDICLHDTTTKCYAGASHPGMSSPRFSHRGENFTPVWNLTTVSCKRETTTQVIPVWNSRRCKFSHVNTPLDFKY